MTDITTLMNNTNGFGVLDDMYNLANIQSNYLFVYILVTIPFFALWIQTRKVVIPAILYMVVGAPMMLIAPPEIKGPAMIMLIFALAGIVYTWFKER